MLALTAANLKSRYRKTIAGFLWVVLNPLIMYGVQAMVFSRVLHINVGRYPLFLLSGLIPWLFIAQSIEMSTGLLVNSGAVLKAYPLHPLVLLGAQILDNAVNFLAAFLLLLVPACLTGALDPRGLLLLPLTALPLIGGVVGMSWALATLNVFFRDVRFVVSFAISVTYFATPIFYPVEFLPPDLRWVSWVNPFYLLILPFQESLYRFDIAAFGRAWLVAATLATLLLTAASGLWSRKKNAIYFHI